MLDQRSMTPPIIFLHIPKTAGQTVHNELARAVGQKAVSPIRVHTQAKDAEQQFPVGYSLYSGHIDWHALDRIARPRFAFSILRDPQERIASFYFYLKKQAAELSAAALERPQNTGKRLILTQNADDYFFGGDAAWQSFIRDHYDNFYCRYFGSGKVRAGPGFCALPNRRKLRSALRALDRIDWVYSIENLTALEEDMRELYGFELNLTGTRINAGEHPVAQKRWPKLLEQFETDAARQKAQSFVNLDYALMARLEL